MKQCPSVSDIWKALEEWAPASLAEEWDNVGIQVGDPLARVKRLVTALDVTIPLVDYAIEQNANMILTHHPLIFSPIKKLDLSTPIPALIARLIKKDIALASAHTNLDSALHGVSDELVSMLNLKEVTPLVPSAESHEASTGIGRTGILPKPLKLKEVIDRVIKSLDVPGVSAAGNPDMNIRKIAVCGGSGSSLWPVFLKCGADLFLTAEIKHNIFREAEMMGLAVIDAGHFATEWPIIPALTRYMQDIAVKRGWDLEILMFRDQATPAAWYSSQQNNLAT